MALAAILSLCRTAGAAQNQQQQLAYLSARQGVVQIGLGVFPATIRVSAPQGLRLRDAATGAELLSSRDSLALSLVEGTVVVSGGATPQHLSAAVIESMAGEGIVLGRHAYKGRLLFRADGGHFTVINEIFLEDYLAGVLAAEIGDAPPEALKAQAVVARSEVIHKLCLGRHRADGYDLCAGEHCMAYHGADEVTPKMTEAVQATRGEVLMADGNVLDAVFHNVCGGITAGAEDVWDSPPIPGLQPVWDVPRPAGLAGFRSEEDVAAFIDSPPADAFCNPAGANYPAYARKYYRWSKVVGAEELRRRTGGSRVLNIRIVERRSSGRVRKLLIETEGGTKVIEKELPIRRMFDLPSGLFVMDVVRGGSGIDRVEFRGAGSGHGVGLCQMGAWGMAQRGYTCDAILRHYYPRADIKKLYR
jgi:SpoIID/LytB domain protein